VRYIVQYTQNSRSAKLGLMAAASAGIGALEDMREKLCFAGNELKRMEDESGIALTQEDNDKIHDYLDAYERINAILACRGLVNSSSSKH
jgi:hypothetical protein